jgi:hypothetical protein
MHAAAPHPDLNRVHPNTAEAYLSGEVPMHFETIICGRVWVCDWRFDRSELLTPENIDLAFEDAKRALKRACAYQELPGFEQWTPRTKDGPITKSSPPGPFAEPATTE